MNQSEYRIMDSPVEKSMYDRINNKTLKARLLGDLRNLVDSIENVNTGMNVSTTYFLKDTGVIDAKYDEWTIIINGNSMGNVNTDMNLSRNFLLKDAGVSDEKYDEWTATINAETKKNERTIGWSYPTISITINDRNNKILTVDKTLTGDKSNKFIYNIENEDDLKTQWNETGSTAKTVSAVKTCLISLIDKIILKVNL